MSKRPPRTTHDTRATPLRVALLLLASCYHPSWNEFANAEGSLESNGEGAPKTLRFVVTTTGERAQVSPECSLMVSAKVDRAAADLRFRWDGAEGDRTTVDSQPVVDATNFDPTFTHLFSFHRVRLSRCDHDDVCQSEFDLRIGASDPNPYTMTFDLEVSCSGPGGEPEGTLELGFEVLDAP